jgi:hypothetical protein
MWLLYRRWQRAGLVVVDQVQRVEQTPLPLTLDTMALIWSPSLAARTRTWPPLRR